MPKPDTSTTFAEDELFSNPSSPADGYPVAIDPGAFAGQGIVPGLTVPFEYLNHQLRHLGRWSRWLAGGLSSEPLGAGVVDQGVFGDWTVSPSGPTLELAPQEGAGFWYRGRKYHPPAGVAITASSIPDDSAGAVYVRPTGGDPSAETFEAFYALNDNGPIGPAGALACHWSSSSGVVTVTREPAYVPTRLEPAVSSVNLFRPVAQYGSSGAVTNHTPTAEWCITARTGLGLNSSAATIPLFPISRVSGSLTGLDWSSSGITTGSIVSLDLELTANHPVAGAPLGVDNWWYLRRALFALDFDAGSWASRSSQNVLLDSGSGASSAGLTTSVTSALELEIGASSATQLLDWVIRCRATFVPRRETLSRGYYPRVVV